MPDTQSQETTSLHCRSIGKPYGLQSSIEVIAHRVPWERGDLQFISGSFDHKDLPNVRQGLGHPRTHLERRSEPCAVTRIRHNIQSFTHKHKEDRQRKSTTREAKRCLRRQRKYFDHRRRSVARSRPMSIKKNSNQNLDCSKKKYGSY